MASVGLLYVGAVLAINGLMLLGYVEARAAAPLNLFVGALQVITPTFLIFTANGNTTTILAASGIYLFGFTYLYVGINLLGNLDGTGVGWFSLFVALCAVVFAALNFFYFTPRDTGFTAIWLYWAALWALFWVVLGIKHEEFTRYTGAIALTAGIITGAVPAFLLLTGLWTKHLWWWTLGLAVLEGLSLLVFLPLRARYQPAVPPAAPVPSGAPEAPEGVPVSREPAGTGGRQRR
jgi:hypothetical protein